MGDVTVPREVDTKFNELRREVTGQLDRPVDDTEWWTAIAVLVEDAEDDLELLLMDVGENS